MATLTRTPADSARIAVLGASLKMEVVELAPAAGAAILDADDFATRLQNAFYGYAFANGANGGDAQVTLTAPTDDSKSVTVELNSGTFENDVTMTVVIFGQ